MSVGANHLTFDGGYGWFRKKISRRLISSEKKSCIETPALHWLCMSGEKFYHQWFWKKNSYANQITHIPPPPSSKVKWSAPYLDFLRAPLQFLWFGVSRRSRSRLVGSLKFIVSFSVVIFHYTVANPYTAERPGWLLLRIWWLSLVSI